MCQPKAAQCLICPLAAHAALEAGKVSEIPPPKPRPKKKLVEMQVGVSWSGKKLLLARRPDSGLFAKTMFPPEAGLSRRQKKAARSARSGIRPPIVMFGSRFSLSLMDARSLGPNGSIPMIRNWHSPAWPAKLSLWPDGIRKTTREKRPRLDRLGTPVFGVEWIADVQ